MSDTLIKVEGLSKKFCTSLKRSMLYGTYDAVRDMAGISFDATQLRKKEFWALQDINFELKRGETLGLIGQNGCGKTTLLRLINGIFPPDKGKITIKGRIGALISVGAGFHPHMTGLENIFLNGTILGMTKNEIKRRLDEIIDFAEVGDFIDSPVATYSSGMTVRLGFAIAIHCEPDILLIDEILAVGDIGFQLKCFNKLGELRKIGTSTILVSHNVPIINGYANCVIYMDKGRTIFHGDVYTGLELYKKAIQIDQIHPVNFNKVKTGTPYFVINDVLFNDRVLQERLEFKTDEKLEITINYTAAYNIPDIEADIFINLNIPGTHFFQVNNEANNKKIHILEGGGKLKIKINNLCVNNSRFDLSVALWRNNKSEVLFWWTEIPCYAKGNPQSSGIVNMIMDYSVSN